MVMLLLHAPLEILVAVVFGLFWGVLVTFLPAQPQPSSAFRYITFPSCHMYLHLCFVKLKQCSNVCLLDLSCCCWEHYWQCLAVMSST